MYYECVQSAIENNAASIATPTIDLQHGDIGLDTTKETVQWLAIECADESEAIEVADLVVKIVWNKDAA